MIKLKSSKNKMQQKFVICVDNQGYEVSLERWKIYRVIQDEKADSHAQIRVVDESGEDYVYPEKYFTPVKLPKSVEEALITAS